MPGEAALRLHGPHDFFAQEPDVLTGIETDDFTFALWRRPLGIDVSLPPLVLAILLLAYPGLVLSRLIRRRFRPDMSRGNACRRCGYDLRGNESGKCPECGTPVTRERERVLNRVKRISWRVPLISSAFLATAILTYVGYSQARLAIQDRVDPNAEPLAEFQHLLPKVASGELADQQSVDSFVELARDPAVRRWMADNYMVVTKEQSFTLMAIVLRTAHDHQFEEFEPLIESAMQLNRYGVAACKALRHYELPNRRELLKTYIEFDNASHQYEIRSALRIYLDLYGVAGIEDTLDRHLSSTAETLRGDVAAIMIARCNGVWRDKAMKTLNLLLSGPYWNWYGIAGFFVELLDANTCGDEELLAHAKRLLPQADENARETLARYVTACGGQPP